MKENIKRNILVGLALVIAGLISISTFGVPTNEINVDPMADNVMGFYPTNSHVTIGDTFTIDFYVDVVNEIDTASADNITFTAGVANYESTTQGDLLPGQVVWMTPEGNGEVNNISGYAYPITWGHSSSVNNTNGTVATISWSASTSSCGVSEINITEGGTALGGGDAPTTKRKGYIYVHPQAPDSLSATVVNATKIDLSWSANIHPYTVIRARTDTYPTSPTDGREVYNNTGTTTSDTGLSPGETYYYSAWGYSDVCEMFSLTYDTDYEQTNQKPEFSSINPVNGSGNQATSITWSVYISDGDSDPMDISIHCPQMGASPQYEAVGQPDGTYNIDLWDMDYDTTYTVYVNATDGIQWTREWFTFTTRESQTPVISLEDPTNGTIGVLIDQSTVSVNIYDPDGDAFDWSIEVSSGESNSAVGANNGSKACPLTTPLTYNTTYTWWVNVTDSYKSVNEWFTFTTTDNLVPNAPTNPDPADEGTEHPYTVGDGNLSCLVTDPEAHNMTVYFYITGMGLVGTDANVANNTRASVDISALSFNFNTTYMWNVTVVDEFGGSTFGPIWNFTTVSESLSGEVDPEVYHYGVMDWDDEKQASLEITNTGNSIIDVEFRIVNGVMLNGDYQWNLTTEPGIDNFTLQLYNPTIGFVNVTDTYTTLYTGLEPAETVEFKVILHIPNGSHDEDGYDDLMEGRMDVRFSDGTTEEVGEFEFDCAPPPEEKGLKTYDSKDVVFLPGGIIDADTWYLTIPSNMTEDTKIELPETYNKKHWVFWRQETSVKSIKVIGIKNDWSFATLNWDGKLDDTITLDIDDIDDWNAFLIIPNPGYFQTSDWWFDLLNDAKNRFVEGESLI